MVLWILFKLRIPISSFYIISQVQSTLKHNYMSNISFRIIVGQYPQFLTIKAKHQPTRTNHFTLSDCTKNGNILSHYYSQLIGRQLTLKAVVNEPQIRRIMGNRIMKMRRSFPFSSPEAAPPRTESGGAKGSALPGGE